MSIHIERVMARITAGDCMDLIDRAGLVLRTAVAQERDTHLTEDEQRAQWDAIDWAHERGLLGDEGLPT